MYNVKILTSGREAEGLSDVFLHKYAAYIWDINSSHRIIFFTCPLVHAGLPVWNFSCSCESGHLVWWAMIFFCLQDGRHPFRGAVLNGLMRKYDPHSFGGGNSSR